ncbi:carbonic anhydrase [Saccharothrix ecbatanensis]|uniref:Carbonic anhydrase n=1 Tax=Saccharothrix ecbatanensis TaxID=1105145 RepID=A0A7W9HJ22_9PSEU|nr:carbonic anhydrase [Saccharothrix ecbatanensis]
MLDIDVTTFQRTWGPRLAAFAHGQWPTVLFVSCSDSRVVPNLITGAEPGKLFEYRTAGNVISPYTTSQPCSASATIEYAVNILGVRDIVVCGHSHCGAVGAAVRGDDLTLVPAVRQWVHGNGIGRESLSAEEADDPALTGAVIRHLATQLANLHTYPEVNRRVSDGRLRVHGWFYEVDTGEVRQLRDGFLVSL